MNKKLYKLKSIIRKIFIKTKYLLIAAAKKGIKYLIRKQFIDSDNNIDIVLANSTKKI